MLLSSSSSYSSSFALLIKHQPYTCINYIDGKNAYIFHGKHPILENEVLSYQRSTDFRYRGLFTMALLTLITHNGNTEAGIPR